MDKIERMGRRRRSIRKRIFGSSEKPRMSIHKSNRNINVQIIDDVEGRTLCALSTLSGELRGKIKGPSRKTVKVAEALGESVAKIAAAKGITKVVFDRGGYKYHGVVKSFADAARKNGLIF